MNANLVRYRPSEIFKFKFCYELDCLKTNLGGILCFILYYIILRNLTFQTRNWFLRSFLSSPSKHDQRVKTIQARVREWNDDPAKKAKKMCTSRPNWLSLSTTFFDKKNCHTVSLCAIVLQYVI